MSISNNPKFENRMTVWEIKTNESGKKVTGRRTTVRKATDFDKMAKDGWVNSSWFIDFTNAEEAKKLKPKDRIIIDQFSITTGELYAEGKYSPTRMTIWAWHYNDAPRQGSAPSNTSKDEVDY